MSNEIDVVSELKAEIRRLRMERDLYRQRAIDEVASHHRGATQQTATFDVDQETMRHLQGVFR